MRALVHATESPSTGSNGPTTRVFCDQRLPVRTLAMSAPSGRNMRDSMIVSFLTSVVAHCMRQSGSVVLPVARGVLCIAAVSPVALVFAAAMHAGAGCVSDSALDVSTPASGAIHREQII